MARPITGNGPRVCWRVPVPGLDKYHGTDTFLTEALTLEAKGEVDKALTAEKPFLLYMSPLRSALALSIRRSFCGALPRPRQK